MNKLTRKEIKRRHYIKNRDKILKYSKEYRLNNKEKVNKSVMKWRIKNPEKVKEINRRYYSKPNAYRKADLKKKYGMTLEQYDDILRFQGGKCAICLSDSSQSKLSKNMFVDHCHKTNTVRGLLCKKCNIALGEMKDDIEILERAIIYLKRYKL